MDESISKGSARGILAHSDKGSRLKVLPLIGRLARKPDSAISNPLNPAAPAGLPNTLSSNLTELRGYAGKDNAYVEHDLLTLDRSRLALEMSLFGRGISHPLFDVTSTSVHPTEFFRQTGNTLHDEIIRQLEGPSGMLAQVGVPDFQTVWANNPTMAMQMLYDANQRAWSTFSSEAAKALLLAEKPSANAAIITARAAGLSGTEAEAPTDDELARLTGEKTISDQAVESITRKVTQLQERLTSAQNNLPEAKRLQSAAQRRWTNISPALLLDITRIEGELTNYRGLRNTLAPAPPPPGLDVAATQAFILAEQQRIASEASRLNELIQTTRTSLQEKATSRDRMLEAVADTEANALFYQGEIADLSDTPPPAGAPPATPPTPGEISRAQAELQTAKTNQRTAEKAVNDRREEVGKTSTDKQNTVAGLKTIAGVVTNYDKIINARFSQGAEGELAINRLTDITNNDNLVAGAERIIEHIAVVGNPSETHNLDLYRKIYSYEAIARSIIWAYKLNPDLMFDGGGVDLRTRLQELTAGKQLAATLASLPRNEPHRVAAEQDIKAREAGLVQMTLPFLRSDQFSVGDMLRFLITRSAESAQKGDPFVRIDDTYLSTRPTLR